ncbi:nuclear transport factor 2 family protein [Chelativorans intermedius]|uniref:Nuclear transport factor 2 family protein n=1 Tax=Chelativorans intermedius TaxID=515947 RepID=A0ABV6D8A5_9HYPH|nr:nuclear transport factor 2 family protein [Chelativorans intermedius]MCT8996814.1 nuclear transport factor 2 family protein [Chelativorans intermedius]
MSETDTRALIERYLAALNAGDHDAMLDCLDDSIAHDTREGRREIGREAFRWALARTARHFREELGDIAIMTAPGGVRAAAEFTVRGTYLASAEGLPPAEGQSYRLQAGMFFEVDDGRITRLSECFSLSALKAALARR